MEVKRYDTTSGMDLGYGSQVQIVRTNYLVVKDAAAATVQQCANFLEAYNNAVSSNARGNSLLKADYIVCSANPPSDAAAGTGANVLPLVATSGANVAFGGNHANPASKKNGTQLHPLAILSLTAIEFTAADLTTAAYVPVVLGDNIAASVGAELLIDNLGAVADDSDTGLIPSTPTWMVCSTMLLLLSQTLRLLLASLMLTLSVQVTHPVQLLLY